MDAAAQCKVDISEMLMLSVLGDSLEKEREREREAMERLAGNLPCEGK